MKYQKNIIFILIINIYFIGCNSDKENISNIEGRAVANGYLQSSTVCLDIDNNNICSKNEPKTITNSDGYFNLNVKNFKSKDIKKSSILIYGGVDKRTKDTFNGKFKISANSKTITLTPLNTIIYFIQQNMDESDDENSIYSIKLLIQTMFIIYNTNLSEDPLKLKNIDSTLFKTTLIIHKVIENLTNNKIDNRDNHIFSIYKKIAKLILDNDKIDFREIIEDIINSDENISIKKKNETNIILNKIEELNYKNDKLIGLKIDSIIMAFKRDNNSTLSKSLNINFDKSIVELRAESILNKIKPYLKNKNINSIKNLIIKILKEAKKKSNYLSLKEEIQLFLSKKESKQIGQILQKIFNANDINILKDSNEDIKLSKLYSLNDNIFLNYTTLMMSIEKNSTLKMNNLFIDKDFNIKLIENKKSTLFLINGKWKDNNLLNLEMNNNILKTDLFTLNIKYIFNLYDYKNNEELNLNFKNINFSSKAKAYLVQEKINSLYYLDDPLIKDLNSKKFNSLLLFLMKNHIANKNGKKVYLNRKFENSITINHSSLIDMNGKEIKILKDGLKGELIVIKKPLLKKYDNVKIVGYWKISKLENSNIFTILLSINDNRYLLYKNKIYRIKKRKKRESIKLFINQTAFNDIINFIKKNK